MKVKLIATYGALAHEKQPVYSYRPTVRADGWNAEETVWVELPDEYIAGRTETGELLVTLDGNEYPLADVITNAGDEPALMVPGPFPRRPIPLHVLAPQELPRVTPGESSIARLRRERGMTQSDLATLVGVEGAHISRWERGERVPKLGALRRIAEALGVDITELIGE